MPSESRFTQRLIKALRARLSSAVILKHSDSYTSGIPDFSITNFDSGPHAKVVWIEVKLLGPPSTMFRALQVEMLRRLGGYYLIWDVNAKKAYFFSATDISASQAEEPLTFKQLVEEIAEIF